MVESVSNGAEFPTESVTELIKEQVTSMIGDQHYSRSHAEEWSKTITESITEGMKKFNLESTKFIINTTILEKTDKCCQTASQCLWDAENDRQIKVRWENKFVHVFVDLFAVKFVY